MTVPVRAAVVIAPTRGRIANFRQASRDVARAWSSPLQGINIFGAAVPWSGRFASARRLESGRGGVPVPKMKLNRNPDEQWYIP